MRPLAGFGLLLALFVSVTLGRAPYTSSQLTDFETDTSDPITMATHPPGNLIIQVAGDDGTFAFDISPDPDGCPDPELIQPSDNSATCTSVEPGNYTISEETPPGSWIVSIDCAETVENSDDSNPPTAAVIVDEGETVTCTFTNTAMPASIVIEQGEAPDTTPVSYSLSANLSDCGPVTLAYDPGPESVTCTDLAPGTYTIAQDPIPAGWAPPVIDCDEVLSVITSITNGVSIDLVAGEDVTCTFTNEPI